MELASEKCEKITYILSIFNDKSTCKLHKKAHFKLLKSNFNVKIFS